MKIKFVGNIFRKKDANVIVFGVPIGKNWKTSLKVLRKASLFVEPFENGKNLLENVRIYDEGNIKLNYLDQIFEKCLRILNNGKIPLILARCHLPTLYALGAFDEKTKIIVFDAHLDMKNNYLDKKIEEMNFFENDKPTKEFNDATWLRRFIEYSYNTNILIIGARSFDRSEIEFARKNKLTILLASKIKEDLNKAMKIIEKFSSNSRIYISLDIDVFDPSIAPSVDHPEPNGLTYLEFSKLVDSIKGKIVGLDLCCFKKIKENEITEFLAVKAIFKVLSRIE